MATATQDKQETGTELEQQERIPTVGDKVSYCLRPYGEWIPAVVINEINESPLEPPFDEGSVHLKIKMDRKKHRSAGSIGYRQEVPQGTTPGCWAWTAPEGWEDAFNARQAAELQAIQIRREAMKNA